MPVYGAGGTVYLKYTTRDTTGLPTTLSGSPVVSIYKDASTTESVAGVTLNVDFDSRTGLNHITVDTTADATFYANGHTYYAVITTGTVASISVIGEVVGNFDLATAALTAAQIATGIWQDTTSADFTTANSIGKSLYTSGAIPGATGGLFIAGSNSTTAVNITGNITGNLSGSVGSVTGNVGGNVVGTVASIVSPGNIWDVVNTGATHNVNSSTGKQLRSIALNTTAIYSSTLPSQAGATSTTVILDSGASAVNNAYQGDVLSVINGTGAGSAVCVSYVGSTRTATLDKTWIVQPIAGDVVEITPTAQVQVVSYLTGQDPATYILITPSHKLATDAIGSVTLADGVAHGGPPGSSTATYAGSRFIIAGNQSTPTFWVTNAGTGEAATIAATGAAGKGLSITSLSQDACSMVSSANAAGLTVQGGGVGFNVQGTFAGMYVFASAAAGAPYAGAIVFEATGGDVVSIIADDVGHGVTIIATGTGKHAISAAGGTISGDSIHLTTTLGQGISVTTTSGKAVVYTSGDDTAFECVPGGGKPAIVPGSLGLGL